MAVGVQRIGDNMRIGITRSRQQSSTKTQRTGISPRVIGVQQTDVNPKAEIIRPYPQNPRETQWTGTNPRTASVQQTSVYLRAVNVQRTDVNLRLNARQWTDINPRVGDARRIDISPMVVTIQRTDGNLRAECAHSRGSVFVRVMGCVEDLYDIEEVVTIFGGPHKAGTVVRLTIDMLKKQDVQSRLCKTKQI